MGINLAELENSIKDDPEPEETETTESESELKAGAEGEEAPDESAPEEDPELEDTAKFKIGDETVTGKDLKAERLRQADYTRKTQELAEDRRAFAQERDGLVEENEELKVWVASLRDPAEMAFELERYFPDTFQTLRDQIIQQAIEEQDMTPTELAAVKRARTAERDAKARAKDDELQSKKDARRETEQRTAELRRTFDGWLQETMVAAGLDPANPKHQKLVRREIQTEHKGKAWTKDTFEEACKEVAGAVGAAPKGKPALPPSTPQGHKRPSARAEPAARSKTHSEDFFKSLRSGR